MKKTISLSVIFIILITLTSCTLRSKQGPDGNVIIEAETMQQIVDAMIKLVEQYIAKENSPYGMMLPKSSELELMAMKSVLDNLKRIRIKLDEMDGIDGQMYMMTPP